MTVVDHIIVNNVMGEVKHCLDLVIIVNHVQHCLDPVIKVDHILTGLMGVVYY